MKKVVICLIFGFIFKLFSFLKIQPKKKKKEKKKRRKQLSKAELLYDENEDDKNEEWIQENYQKKGVTDAILSCPGCFSTVCFDCQQ